MSIQRIVKVAALRAGIKKNVHQQLIVPTKLKKHGKKAKDITDTIEFILERNF